MFTKVTPKPTSTKPVVTGLPVHYPVRSAHALLSSKHAAPLLKRFPALTNAPHDYYKALYKPFLIQLAEFVQGLPAAKSPTYHYHGGLLDLALERAYRTLVLYRREFPVQNVAPEDMPAKLSLWTYALFTAGAVYGLGQIVATYWVVACNEKGHHGVRWQPLSQTLAGLGSHYRYCFESTNRDDLAARATPLIARQLLPEVGFDWIAQDAEVLDYWLAILQNDHRGGGAFAKFVMQADDEITLLQQALLAELNLPHKPGIGRLELIEQKISFLDQQNDLTTNEFREKAKHFSSQPSSTPYATGRAPSDLDVFGANTVAIGDIFIQWLRNAIRGQSLSVNYPDSLVHTTAEGLILAHPEIFQDFLKAHPEGKSWQAVVKSLQQLGYSLNGINQADQFKNKEVRSPSLAGLAQSRTRQPGQTIRLDLSAVYDDQAVNTQQSKLQINAITKYPSLNKAAPAAAPPNQEMPKR